MKRAIIFWVCIVFAGCASSPVPKGIMTPDQMQKVVYDIMQADEYIASFLYKDTSLDMKKERSMYYEKIFKLHNTNQKNFYKSLKYYQQHPDIQKQLFDSLSEKAKNKKPEPIKVQPPKLKREA